MRSARRLFFAAALCVACTPPGARVAQSAPTTIEEPVVTKDSSEDAPAWDEEMAADLVGVSVIVGITYLHADGTLESRVQMFGTIVSAHPQDGVMISLRGDRTGET